MDEPEKRITKIFSHIINKQSGRMVCMSDVVSFPIVIMKEGNWFVAACPALDIATQGKTEQEVKESMEELIHEYLNDKDTLKPERVAELSSLSFVHAKLP